MWHSLPRKRGRDRPPLVLRTNLSYATTLDYRLDASNPQTNLQSDMRKSIYLP
jgi:hypothetical protein